MDDIRGTPMSVGNLEEMIDDSHAIVSSSIGLEDVLSLPPIAMTLGVLSSTAEYVPLVSAVGGLGGLGIIVSETARNGSASTLSPSP